MLLNDHERKKTHCSLPSDIWPEIFPHHFEAVSVDRSNRCRQLCQQEYFMRHWTPELWPSWKDDGRVETRGQAAVGTRPWLISRTEENVGTRPWLISRWLVSWTTETSSACNKCWETGGERRSWLRLKNSLNMFIQKHLFKFLIWLWVRKH